MVEFGLTDAGLNLPRAEDIRERFEAEYELATGENPNWDRDEFLGALRVAVAEAVEDNAGSIQDIWDALDRETASGVALDIHASLVGINRQKATFSTVELAVDGETGTEVPAGSEVEDENGVRWELQEDVTLPGTVIAQADERGPIYAEIGEINTIVTPVTGWQTATNSAPPTTGRARQTDPELRTAIRRRLRGGVGSSPLGLRNELEQLSFVDRALVIHNPTNAEAQVEGITLPEHSFRAVVYPSNLTEEQEDRIFDTLYLVAPIGIEPTGDQVQFIDNWPLKFQYPTEIELGLILDIQIDPRFDFDEVKPEAEASIIEYFNELEVGEDARFFAMIPNLEKVPGLVDVDSPLFYVDGGFVGGQPSIDISATEIGIPDPDNIEVAEV